MATHTLTTTSVVPASTATKRGASAGAAIAAGELIYLDAADLDADGNPKAKLAQCDGAAAEAVVIGMAVNGAASGQSVSYVKSGVVTVQGGAFTKLGHPLALSPTAGKSMDADDLADGERVTFVGWTITATTFMLDIDATGVVYNDGVP